MTNPAHIRVTALITSMIGAVVLLTLIIDGFYIIDQSELVGLVVMGFIFMISERLIFHVEARTEAVGYTPSDVALGIGVLFFGPCGLLLTRLVGASLGMLLFRRSTPIKFTFNLAIFALETVIAYALFRFATGAEPSLSLPTWLGLTTSLFLALLVSGLLVATAVSCLEGGLLDRVKAELAHTSIFYLPGALVAGALAIGTMAAPFLGIVIASLLPMLWIIVRSHGKLLHRYTDLIGAHEFSREVGDASELTHLLSTAATQIASNMRCSVGAIRVWDPEGIRTEGFHGGRRLACELPSDREALALASFNFPSAEQTPRDAELDRLQVLLGDEQGVLGCVVVADRLGVNTSFEIDDLRRLKTMTQQLTVAVRKEQLHAQIRYEATHDRLTGLANRGFFEAWINESVSAEDQRGCVLFLDLDRFKDVNDAFGHHAGDALLQEVARRLQLASPVNGLASRFGGDEFAVFAPNIDLIQAGELADRIAEALDEPFELDQAFVAIAPSIGIVDSPAHGRVAATLLRKADIAMYDAKKRPNRSSIYRNELEEDDSARLKMLVDLRSAIADDELEVHFQPQVDIRTGTVIGAEALARWTHPTHGVVNPATFVELAESAGLIDALTNRVLGRALAAAAQWQRRGWDMNIAVNISARSLLDHQLVQLVESQLAASGLEASRLTLEITESTMMSDPARTHRMLHTLTSLGVTISVDDFGTGYSSLSKLGHLPVSELKIDRSFVMAMTTSEHDAIIVRSTIDLAHNLGLKAVAEGVEDQALHEQLMHLDCDLAQGYGISRPLPLQQFNHWFLERTDAASAISAKEATETVAQLAEISDRPTEQAFEVLDDRVANNSR